MVWTGQFVAVDGEGWQGKYTLLALSCMDFDLYNPKGLSTLDCLEYLTAWKIPKNAAVVGYGLSYDFENILRDIPDEDYLKMTEENEKIRFHEFEIRYIPRKILEITRHTNRKDKRGRPISKTVFIQDVIGFFQASFEEALKKWNIPVPDIISNFKAKRNEFGPKMIKDIKRYNRTELDLLIRLMESLREADIKAFEAIGLKNGHGPRAWYGPGARAANILKQTRWIEEHPPFVGPDAERLKEAIILRSGIPETSPLREQIREHPFSAAYYGGRIEAAANGLFEQPLYDYDINSAYPWALANFPKWEENDLLYVEGLDARERIGIYYVEWHCPEGYNFYPFPYRSRGGNVFFPSSGRGWYMSPEVHQAKRIWGDYINVVDGWVIRETDFAGSGNGGLPDWKICSTGLKVREMAAVRLKAKAAKESSEKSLKLFINSVYGKTIQQVGSHKFLNLVAAAWITSSCRALILRTIGRGEHVISIMTDGVLSTVPFDVPLGKNLGEFEVKEFDRLIQFMPGVYHLSSKTGETMHRYRGMNKDFDAEKALPILYSSGKKYRLTMRIFVTRRLSIHQPNVFGKKRYQFVEVEKEEEFSLKSKRVDSENFRIRRKNQKNKFYPPKPVNFLEFLATGSKPYVMDLPSELPYDTAKTMDELLSDNRILSAMESGEN